MAAGKNLLEDIAELNAEMAAHLTGPGVNFVSTGDLLTGVENSSMGTLMDSLYEVWNQDPVHGERQAFFLYCFIYLKQDNSFNRICTRIGVRTLQHQWRPQNVVFPFHTRIVHQFNHFSSKTLRIFRNV